MSLNRKRSQMELNTQPIMTAPTNRYDNKKGFFCQVMASEKTKCLGKSKGRAYPQMEDRAYKLLQRYYLSHNTALVKLLKRLGWRSVPQWLKEDLSDFLPA